jgi:hypothetical protein
VSASLTSVAFDDHLQQQVNGAIVYNSYGSWDTGPFPAGRCETGRNSAFFPNVDLTGPFRVVGPVDLKGRVAVGDLGEQLVTYEIRVREGCEVVSEQVIDGCTGLAANSLCRLRNEWVDGVQTVRDGRTTGLGPLASSRMVGLSCQVDSGPRQWWETRREYECRTTTATHDLEYARDRARVVRTTVDPTTGQFQDRRLTAPGTYTTSGEALSLPTPDPVEPCTPMCRTRKPRPGVSAGVPGPQSTLNATGVAYDFTFKACDAGVCPLEPGETQVAACDCRSNFAQAASMMQAIRMVAEDTVCTP